MNSLQINADSLVDNYTLVVGISLKNSLLSVNKCVNATGNIQLQPTQKCHYPGLFAQSIATQLRAAGLKYVIRVLLPHESSQQARYELMQNGSIDLVASNHWHINQQRLDQGFQFSIPTEIRPVYSALLAVGVKQRPDLWEGASAYTNRVFSPCIWLCVALLYLLIKIYAHLPQRSHYRAQLLPVFVHVLGALCLGVYGNRLLVNILHHSLDLPFTDYDSMLAAVTQGNINLVRNNNPWFDALLKKTQISLNARRFKAAIDQSNPVKELSGKKRTQMINSGQYFEIKTADTAAWRVATSCALMAVEMEELGPLLTGIMFSPATPKQVINRINEGISMSYAVKLSLYEKYMNQARIEAALICAEHDHEHETINLPSMLFVFLTLVLVYGLAAFCCAAESFWHPAKYKQKHNHCTNQYNTEGITHRHTDGQEPGTHPMYHTW